MVQQQIIEMIQTYDTIIIHRHVRPDPDAIGSQCGLKEMILTSFPNKKVYAVGEEESSLSYLAQMDQIDDATYQGALVITCDTANTARISDERYHFGEKLIKIDHHPNKDVYGDLLWVDTDASSTSEMIYELYVLGKDQGFQMNAQIARLIYGGIVGDTGRFLFPSTTDKTFHYAAELIKYDFDRQALYDGLYRVSPNIARLQGHILQHYTFYDCGLGTITLTEDILKEYEVDPKDTGRVVGTLGDIAGIKVWVFFIEEPDVIRVRIRSKGPVINDVAATYNGGGHPLASGASVHSWEETEKVIKDLKSVCQ